MSLLPLKVFRYAYDYQFGQSIIFISHITMLEQVSTAALHNRRFARGIRILHINLGALPWGYIRILRKLLAVSDRLTDLILDLPRGSSAVLRNIRLKRLVLFQTNFLHRDLSQFLRLHPLIEYLRIRSCGAKKGLACPLADVRLPHLKDLACPLTCTSLANAATLRLAATYQGIRDSRTPVFRIVQSAVGAHLTVLHIDFDPTDFGLLRSIAENAPSLTALKLTEECSSEIVGRPSTLEGGFR